MYSPDIAIRYFAPASTDCYRLPGHKLYGEIEAGENYFGGVQEGRQDRALSGKVAAFSLSKWLEVRQRLSPISSRFCPSLRREWKLIALSTPTVYDPAIHGMYANFYYRGINHPRLFMEAAVKAARILVQAIKTLPPGIVSPGFYIS